MLGHRGFRWLIAAALVFGAASIARGDSQTIRQSGNVTAGHAPYWIYNGVVGDAGTADIPYITDLGVLANGGRHFCVSTSNNHILPYYQLCLGISEASAYLTVDAYAGGTAPPFAVCIQGICYPFPGSTPVITTPIRVVASGTTDSVVTNDQNGTVSWHSSATAAKSEVLFQCVALVFGFTVTIKDEIGTAQAYPIVVTSVSSIDNSTLGYSIHSNLGSATFQCSPTGNWIVK